MNNILATTTELFRLPSGSEIAIPKAQTQFAAWTKELIGDTYGGKQVLNFEGKPAFAELAILWALQRDGWEGVWIDSYRNKYRVDYWDSSPVEHLPDTPADLLERIYHKTGKRGGAWDVFCWRQSEILFAESKRKRRDSIRHSQLTFLEAALSVGMSANSFLVVEWDLVP